MRNIAIALISLSVLSIHPLNAQSLAPLDSEEDFTGTHLDVEAEISTAIYYVAAAYVADAQMTDQAMQRLNQEIDALRLELQSLRSSIGDRNTAEMLTARLADVERSFVLQVADTYPEAATIFAEYRTNLGSGPIDFSSRT